MTSAAVTSLPDGRGAAVEGLLGSIADVDSSGITWTADVGSLDIRITTIAEGRTVVAQLQHTPRTTRIATATGQATGARLNPSV
eukprot:3419037-Amphidinium_carterae.2